MRIAEIMTRDIAVVEPGDSIRRAAQLMDNLDIRELPVCDGKKLVGIITDRTASDVRDPEKTKVAAAMIQKVRWCFATDEVSDVVNRMDGAQIRRVPVLDRKRHLVGIVSLGDLAAEESPPQAEEALGWIFSRAAHSRS